MTDFDSLGEAARKLDPSALPRVLDRVLELWRHPGSPWRVRLAEQHPLFTREVLDHGTTGELAGWTRDALEELRRREVPEPCAVPRVTAVWLAGSIPTAAFRALLLPLLAGSAVYASPSSKDPLSPRLFAESLASVDPALGACLELGHDPAGLERADAVVVHGTDETVAKLRARVGVEKPFVAHPHKLSIAAIGPEADLAAAAEAVALDAALYDGRGCLSPAYVVVPEAPPGRAAHFARALAAALEDCSTRLPAGRPSPAEAAELAERRARAAMRPATTLELPRSGSGWAVLLEPADSHPEPALLRSVPVIPLSPARPLADWCGALAPHLSSLGHCGWSGRERELLDALRSGGGSRLCATGHLQRPRLAWNQDGARPIASLLKRIDVEQVGGGLR